MKTIHFSQIPATLALTALMATAPLADAATYTWNTATPGYWSSIGSWTGGPPGTGDTAVFSVNADTSSSSATINNTVDSPVPYTIAALTFDTTVAADYNVTSIPTGQTLTVTGPVLVGGQNGSAFVTQVYMTGGGTFVATGTPFTVQNFATASGAGNIAYLNLSGLNNFIYSNRAGTISIVDNAGSLTRPAGNVTLAAVSNFITVSNLNLGTSAAAQAGASGSGLTLGPGTNIINAVNFNLDSQKNTFTLTGSSPAGLRIRGVSGANTDRSTITIGNRNVSSSTGGTTGTLALNGCQVDIKAATLTVGEAPNAGGAPSGSAGFSGNGVMSFDTGTVDATSVVLAYNTSANGGGGTASSTGVLNVGATGTLLVGGGGISLATQTSNGPATGTLNIANGATVTCDGNITEAMGTNVGTSSLNLGGALNMGLDTYIGTGNQPINNFTLSNNATLQLTPLSGGQTNIFVNTLNWPSPDSGMTIDIAGLPAGAAAGSNYVLFNAVNSIGNAPNPFGGTLILPGTLTGNVQVDATGTNIVLNITGGSQGPVPATPTLFTGTLEGSNQVVLNWTDSGATSYDILRSTTLAGPYSFIAEGFTGTTYTDTSVVSGVGFYYYEIIGVDAGGPSATSSPDTVPYGTGNQLINPGFETLPAKSGWASSTNTTVITTNGAAYYSNATNGPCHDAGFTNLVVSHSGTNVARLYGASNGVPNTAFLDQILPTASGSTLTAGAFAYVSHEDIMASNDNFYCEVDFLDGSGNLLAAYESYVVSNLTCGETSPFAVDAWNFLEVTNVMQVTGGVNTGTVTGNLTNGVFTAPPGAASVVFKSLFTQSDGHAGGSVYIDDAEMVLLTGPVPPTLSTVAPNGVTLCTNTAFTCTASSSLSTITNFQVILTTSTLGGSPTTVTNNYGANGSVGGVTVAGIGTATARITNGLTANTVYSIVVKATDHNGVTVTSPTDLLDTVVPVLVIEASDFNFSGGSWLETPANGGVALYVGKAGETNVDYGGTTRTNAEGYYRPGDAVIISGTGSTSQTEQKFVTSIANGDTTDTEQDIGYNSPGEWENYTRSFGSASTNSAPAGSYNVWLFSATSGSGPQEDLYLVTNSAPVSSTTQGSNFIGVFGTTNYVNTSYNNYVYLPLLDQFGNIETVTFSGTETLKAVVAPSPANPNTGFYLLTPPVPVLKPGLTYVNPIGTGLFEDTNEFTFTVNANAGAPIAASGISLLLNGVNVTPGLSLTQAGTAWMVNYQIYQNTLYTAVINVTNTAGSNLTYSVSFDTFSTNNYEWEAVDYDFSTNGGYGNGGVSGVFIDDPVPTADAVTTVAGSTSPGTLATNSYYGYPEDLPGNSAPLPGVDVGWVTAGGQVTDYRADGVATQPTTDTLRGKFTAARLAFNDPNIGPFNICYYTNGSWLNYTRHYPTNNFYVWGRLAGTPAYTNTQMSILTSGYGTSIQTSNVLGTFSDPNAAGFQAWHWLPLLDSNGNMAEVSLGQGAGGIDTLQVTSGSPQYCNMEFFMLVPVPPQFSLTASVVSGQPFISFPTETGFEYTILYKSSLTAADWYPVGPAINGDGTVQTVSVSGAPGFYRATAH